MAAPFRVKYGAVQRQPDPALLVGAGSQHPALGPGQEGVVLVVFFRALHDTFLLDGAGDAVRHKMPGHGPRLPQYTTFFAGGKYPAFVLISYYNCIVRGKGSLCEKVES
mgnify:CR=1 FL=1